MADRPPLAELPAMPDDWGRALAIVAHPDDLEYGAAAAVAHWTSDGREVGYLLVTRGEAGIDGMQPERAARVRTEEQHASAEVVGVRSVEFLDHRDGVIEYGVPLRRDITMAIRRHRPELVVTLNHRDTWFGSAWNTPDHRAVGRAVLDAAGDSGNRWIFTDPPDGPSPWDGVRWVAVAGSERPTHTLTVTANDAERAVASLAEHRAYITGLGADDPLHYARTFIEGVLSQGGRHLVAFEVFPR